MRNTLLILFSASCLLSCHKDPVVTDKSAKLSFSDDTIIFDTVFTTIGSTTRQLKIYNTSSRRIIISSLRLARGGSSMFRINVNGTPGKSFSDVEIAGKDSIFVFAEVTVDPNNITGPMIVTDSIVFETNGNLQDVDLVAWGQDAYFYTPLQGSLFGTIPCNSTWLPDKPHVVYGYIFVDSSCTLNINQGTQVYFHNNSGLFVYNGGSLRINGVMGNEVVLRGDRLEQDYKDIPGQWGMIWLGPGSVDNKIEYAVIKNANIGIRADTVGNSNPTLILKNTIMENMSGLALWALGANIVSENCVFANCGQYLSALTIGGSYSFKQCTFANYWGYGNRQTPALLMNNYYTDTSGTIQHRDLNAYFGNCILYGDIDKEIAGDFKTGAASDFVFDHCLLKTTDSTTSPANYKTVIVNEDPKFKNTGDNIYELDTLSAAIDKGDVSIAAAVSGGNDIKGVSRVSGSPDLGAYERKP